MAERFKPEVVELVGKPPALMVTGVPMVGDKVVTLHDDVERVGAYHISVKAGAYWFGVDECSPAPDEDEALEAEVVSTMLHISSLSKEARHNIARAAIAAVRKHMETSPQEREEDGDE